MKTNLLTLIGIAFVLSACGKAPELQLGEFAPYVKTFELKSAELGNPVKVVELKVRFGKMKSERENGACELRDDATPTITINQAKWAKMSEAKRESLIFHELGHCVLYRKHVDTVTTEGVPISIMNPYALDPETYEHNHDYYMHELFGAAPATEVKAPAADDDGSGVAI